MLENLVADMIANEESCGYSTSLALNTPCPLCGTHTCNRDPYPGVELFSYRDELEGTSTIVWVCTDCAKDARNGNACPSKMRMIVKEWTN